MMVSVTMRLREFGESVATELAQVFEIMAVTSKKFNLRPIDTVFLYPHISRNNQMHHGRMWTQGRIGEIEIETISGWLNPPCLGSRGSESETVPPVIILGTSKRG